MERCIDKVFEEFSTPLRNFIKKRVPNDQDVEDILQDVFLKIYQNIINLTDENKIHTWVYTLTRNTIIDFYRKKNKNVEFVELYDDLQNETKEDSSLNGEIASCLKAMIERLPEKYKQAIILTEYQNLTQKELGEKMELSISGAKSRVQRAREKIKDMILECCALEFDRLGNVIDYKYKSDNCNC